MSIILSAHEYSNLPMIKTNKLRGQEWPVSPWIQYLHTTIPSTHQPGCLQKSQIHMPHIEPHSHTRSAARISGSRWSLFRTGISIISSQLQMAHWNWDSAPAQSTELRIN